MAYGASNDVTLRATGAVSDATTGVVKAAGLKVIAANSSSLNSVTNDVVTLAASITGAAQSFTYKDANTVAIRTVGGTSGITTSGGAVTLTTEAGGITGLGDERTSRRRRRLIAVRSRVR